MNDKKKNNILFNFFCDAKMNAVEKLSEYLFLRKDDVKRALVYGCTVESFINDLKIDLNKGDSSEVGIIGRHITTSSDERISSFRNTGLLNLRAALEVDTPLSDFLKKHKIKIDVDNRIFNFKAYSIPIEGTKFPDHRCFMGHDKVCSWSSGCDAFQKLGILDNKLYNLGATLEFFVAGTLDEMLEYSSVSRCPEILVTIDELISCIHNPYRECTYPLCCDWMSTYPNCYAIEFESCLSNMETFEPINYLNAFEEIKNCFLWSNITYYDYYERRVPQRVFDNIYLIRRIIDIYVYGSKEQYGSLQPGFSIDSDELKLYRVDGKMLIEV